MKKYLFLIIFIFFSFNLAYTLTQDEETLLDASIFGDDDIVKKLIAKNINLNVQDEAGNTALILASMEGHTKVVALLLNANADKYIVNNDGNDAIFYAKQKNYKNIIKLLE
ncbi:ankyrin repeat domain-containing protein [Brachyspira pilosicoli]|uniref:ankyrin repeat domain-containing protein n=1 Tax=Brachyspira pilosicoli TaxID=52584 RepID=UPI00300478AF